VFVSSKAAESQEPFLLVKRGLAVEREGNASSEQEDQFAAAVDTHTDPNELPREFTHSRSRLMSVEEKSQGLEGKASIGRVYCSQSGKTLSYRGAHSKV
jgi:hypothetical protein